MNVKELKALLSAYPDDMHVRMQWQINDKSWPHHEVTLVSMDDLERSDGTFTDCVSLSYDPEDEP